MFQKCEERNLEAVQKVMSYKFDPKLFWSYYIFVGRLPCVRRMVLRADLCFQPPYLFPIHAISSLTLMVRTTTLSCCRRRYEVECH